MDFGTSPAVLDALHAGVDAMAFGYLSRPLVAGLAQACAGWLDRAYGWTVPAERIHPVGDVMKALEATLESLVPPDATVILPTPGYMPFLTVPPSIGHDVVQVPGRQASDGRWSIDLDALEGALARTDNGLLVVCNPWNPVGTVLTRAELVAVSELVARHPGIRVFADEIHGPLVYPGAEHVPYASISDVAARHSVTALSASKAWNMPGLKTAQLILTSDEDEERWPSMQYRAANAASNLGVLASTAAFSAGQPWLDAVLDYLDGSRLLLADMIAAELPGVSHRPPDGTYLAWLDCRPLDLPTQPAEFFRQHAGVFLVDGSATGTVGAGYVRLNFATPRPILREIVRRMGAAVRAEVASGAARGLVGR